MASEVSGEINSLADMWEFARNWSVGIIKDMTPEELLFRPGPNRNHAWWLYGHMVVSSEIGPYFVKRPKTVPAEWAQFFDMGTRPSDDGHGYPDKGVLMEKLGNIIDGNVAAIRTLRAEQLDELPPIPPRAEITDYFDNSGKIISGFALHLVYHAGQIATIRRLLGK
jgi:hypothetical protein